VETEKGDAPPAVSAERTIEIDDIVRRARDAAGAFRNLGQAEVDAIVSAMVVAGLEAAVDLAQMAVEETGFGVFEDKVVKNYVATEFRRSRSAAARGAARPPPTTSTTGPCSMSRPSPAGACRRSGSGCRPTRTSTRARSRICARSRATRC